VAPRLASGVWVSAYLARLRVAAIPVYVTAHGDDSAGAVIVKLATLDGRARVYQRITDPGSGGRSWDVLAEGDEVSVDAVIARARSRDRDLWVIEVEDRQGRAMLEEGGL
jgi:hypothetical protein